MLVLSRKINESVMIGTDIRVQVVEIDRDRVRLGFEAPDTVTIHRDQVWERNFGRWVALRDRGLT